MNGRNTLWLFAPLTAALATALAATPAAALATALATAALKLRGPSGKLLGASGASEELQMSFKELLRKF